MSQSAAYSIQFGFRLTGDDTVGNIRLDTNGENGVAEFYVEDVWQVVADTRKYADREGEAARKSMLHDCIADVVTASRRRIQHDCGDGTTEFVYDDEAVKRAVENLMRHVFETAGVS